MANENNVVARLVDVDTGTEVIVTNTGKGFSVRLYDVDAEEFFPASHSCDNMNLALRKAVKINSDLSE